MTTVASPRGGSSPSIADIKDVFPSPVPPTTAIRLPTGISRFIFDNVSLAACKGAIQRLELNIIYLFQETLLNHQVMGKGKMK